MDQTCKHCNKDITDKQWQCDACKKWHCQTAKCKKIHNKSCKLATCSDKNCPAPKVGYKQCDKCKELFCRDHHPKHESQCTKTAPEAETSAPQGLASSKFFTKNGLQLMSSLMPLPRICSLPTSLGDDRIEWLCKLADPTMEQKATHVFKFALDAILKRPEPFFGQLVCTAFNGFRSIVRIYEKIEVLEERPLLITDDAHYVDPFSKRPAGGAATGNRVVFCFDCKGAPKATKELGEKVASLVVHEFTHFFCQRVFGFGSLNTAQCDPGDKSLVQEGQKKQIVALNEFETSKCKDAAFVDLSQHLKKYKDEEKDAEFLAHLMELRYQLKETVFLKEFPQCEVLIRFLFDNKDWQGLKNTKKPGY